MSPGNCSHTVQVFVVHAVIPPPQALHIMVGLLNIGLGLILICSQGYAWWMRETMFPVWIGALVSKRMLYLFFCVLTKFQPSFP